MKVKRWLPLMGLTVVIALPAFGQETKNAPKYVGTAGCKACHMTKKSGAAYKIWKSTTHANAYATLASDQAKAIAEKKGIADPQKADECLQCHVTAFGVSADQLGPKFKTEDGVGCESCHGPGSEYKPRKVMKAITAGAVDPASVGLKKAVEADCKQCHNEKSPAFKGFDFQKMYAKIAHEIPEVAAK